MTATVGLARKLFNMSKGVTFWKQAGLSYLQFLTISTRAVRSGLKVDVDYIDDGGLNSCQSLQKLTVMKYNVQYIGCPKIKSITNYTACS